MSDFVTEHGQKTAIAVCPVAAYSDLGWVLFEGWNADQNAMEWTIVQTNLTDRSAIPEAMPEHTFDRLSKALADFAYQVAASMAAPIKKA